MLLCCAARAARCLRVLLHLHVRVSATAWTTPYTPFSLAASSVTVHQPVQVPLFIPG